MATPNGYKRAQMEALDKSMGAAVRRELLAQGIDLPVHRVDWGQVGCAVRNAVLRHCLVGDME